VRGRKQYVASRRHSNSWLWWLQGGFFGYRLLAKGYLTWPFMTFARLLSLRDGRSVEVLRQTPDGIRAAVSTDALCSFGALHYELGDLRDLSELEGIDPNAPYMKVLRAGRVQRFSESRLSALDLAAMCVRRTLEEARCDPRDVDALVLASDRLLQSTSYPQLNGFLDQLGLSRTSVVGVGLSGCTNATVALRTAAAFQRAERCRRILVVSVDTLPSDPEHRIQPQGTCVFSDAALSFMVSPPGEGEFDVLGIEHESALHVGHLDMQGDTVRAMRDALGAPRAAVARLLSRASLRPADIRGIFAANFIYGVALAQARMCGFKESQCYFDNIPRFGHTYAGDPFINLKDSVTSTGNRGLFVLVGSFTTSWDAVLVRRV
jgi:3-oxoacyl-[acyl-carrier-protein] synthase III